MKEIKCKCFVKEDMWTSSDVGWRPRVEFSMLTHSPSQKYRKRTAKLRSRTRRRPVAHLFHSWMGKRTPQFLIPALLRDEEKIVKCCGSDSLASKFLSDCQNSGIRRKSQRFNNAYRGPPAQHAGMIFYFPFMSLVFAQRERIVSNLARLVVVVWMFVVLILSSTYTASLSARLTVQRLQPAVTDVKELIRKGDYVGCHKGSFIVDLLQELGFNKFKIRTYEHPEDCDEALSKGSEKGGISALFSVTPYTKLFLSTYCDKYTTVGPTYPTEGFAYVFPKASPLVSDVSRAVIELTDNGRISEIEKEWINNSACNGPDGTVTATSVSLQSFRTLFGITGGITATSLVVFLITYLYKNRDFVERISSSSTTIWSKLCAICKHFDERDPKSFGSSRAKEDGENALPNPNLSVNPRSSTVVPISSVEMGDINTQQSTPATPP